MKGCSKHATWIDIVEWLLQTFIDMGTVFMWPLILNWEAGRGEKVPEKNDPLCLVLRRFGILVKSYYKNVIEI